MRIDEIADGDLLQMFAVNVEARLNGAKSTDAIKHEVLRRMAHASMTEEERDWALLSAAAARCEKYTKRKPRKK